MDTQSIPPPPPPPLLELRHAQHNSVTSDHDKPTASCSPCPPIPPPMPGSRSAIKLPNWKDELLQKQEKLVNGSKTNYESDIGRKMANRKEVDDGQQQLNSILTQQIKERFASRSPIPDKLLSTMNGDKKPFTYTPAGVPGEKGKLDLSQIKSPKMRKRLLANLEAGKETDYNDDGFMTDTDIMNDKISPVNNKVYGSNPNLGPASYCYYTPTITASKHNAFNDCDSMQITRPRSPELFDQNLYDIYEKEQMFDKIIKAQKSEPSTIASDLYNSQRIINTPSTLSKVSTFTHPTYLNGGSSHYEQKIGSLSDQFNGSGYQTVTTKTTTYKDPVKPSIIHTEYVTTTATNMNNPTNEPLAYVNQYDMDLSAQRTRNEYQNNGLYKTITTTTRPNNNNSNFFDSMNRQTISSPVTIAMTPPPPPPPSASSSYSSQNHLENQYNYMINSDPPSKKHLQEGGSAIASPPSLISPSLPQSAVSCNFVDQVRKIEYDIDKSLNNLSQTFNIPRDNARSTSRYGHITNNSFKITPNYATAPQPPLRTSSKKWSPHNDNHCYGRGINLDRPSSFLPNDFYRVSPNRCTNTPGEMLLSPISPMAFEGYDSPLYYGSPSSSSNGHSYGMSPQPGTCSSFDARDSPIGYSSVKPTDFSQNDYYSHSDIVKSQAKADPSNVVSDDSFNSRPTQSRSFQVLQKFTERLEKEMERLHAYNQSDIANLNNGSTIEPNSHRNSQGIPTMTRYA